MSGGRASASSGKRAPIPLVARVGRGEGSQVTSGSRATVRTFRAMRSHAGSGETGIRICDERCVFFLEPADAAWKVQGASETSARGTLRTRGGWTWWGWGWGRGALGPREGVWWSRLVVWERKDGLGRAVVVVCSARPGQNRVEGARQPRVATDGGRSAVFVVV